MRTGKWQGQPGPGLKEGAPSYFCHCPFHRDAESLLQGHQPLPGRQACSGAAEPLPSSGSTKSSPQVSRWKLK